MPAIKKEAPDRHGRTGGGFPSDGAGGNSLRPNGQSGVAEVGGDEMKKAVSLCCFYGKSTLEEKLQLAREAGFSGLEVDLSENGPIHFTTSERELSDLRKKVEQHGLQLSGLMTFLYWGANAASADANQRSQADRILQRQLDCAQKLGIDTILVVPGSVGVDFIPGSEVVPYEVAYTRATDFIRRGLPYAEKRKVTLAVENVWNKFLLSPLEMRSFIDQFAHPLVGAYLDVANTLAYGYPEDWVRTLGPRIRRVHVKDYRRAVGTVDGFCDLLSGNVNWPEVMQALRDVPYTGWVTAEMIPPVPFYQHAPEVLLHTTSRAMDAILRFGAS